MPSEKMLPGSERCIIVVFDLAHPEGWAAARDALDMLGRRHSQIEPLDLDRIAIVFRPGGAWRLP
jgi:hypothetical protein